MVSQDLSIFQTFPQLDTWHVCGREGPLQVWCALFTILTAGRHIFRVSLLPCFKNGNIFQSAFHPYRVMWSSESNFLVNIILYTSTSCLHLS